MFRKDSSCPLPLHEGIGQVQPGVRLPREGFTGPTTRALPSRWPVMPGGTRYFALPSILFSESLVLERADDSRFAAPRPRGANPAGKAQAAPRASTARAGRGCLRRACWLLIASEKAASGGSLHPRAVIQPLKLLSACSGGIFTWVGAARERLRSPRDVSFLFLKACFLFAAEFFKGSKLGAAEGRAEQTETL